VRPQPAKVQRFGTAIRGLIHPLVQRWASYLALWHFPFVRPSFWTPSHACAVVQRQLRRADRGKGFNRSDSGNALRGGGNGAVHLPAIGMGSAEAKPRAVAHRITRSANSCIQRSERDARLGPIRSSRLWEIASRKIGRESVRESVRRGPDVVDEALGIWQIGPHEVEMRVVRRQAKAGGEAITAGVGVVV
jgi:hypothetical protein